MLFRDHAMQQRVIQILNMIHSFLVRYCIFDGASLFYTSCIINRKVNHISCHCVAVSLAVNWQLFAIVSFCSRLAQLTRKLAVVAASRGGCCAGFQSLSPVTRVDDFPLQVQGRN